MLTGGRVEIDVLGPFTCRVDSVHVCIAPILSSVLASLIVRRGGSTPAAALADLVWAGEAIPATSHKTLHGHISRLRSALGAAAIESRGSSYRINPIAVRVDVLAFESASSEIERLHLRSEPENVVKVASEALDLWRGRPFEDVDATMPAGEIERLTEIRRRIEEFRVRALLDLRRSAQVIPGLEATVAHDPLRETVWAQLMTALQGTGRTVDALHAYGRARRALAESLGIEPGAALRILEARILRGESLITSLPAPTPTPIVSIMCRRPVLRTWTRQDCRLPALVH